MVEISGGRKVFVEKELGAVLLLTVLFFWRPLTIETFFFRDLHLLFFFQRVKVALALGCGHLPLWDPFLHGGQPLLANLNNTALYPGNLLYLALSPVTAFNLEIVLHFALSGVFGYLAARVVSLSPAASLLSAVVLEFCGLTLSMANLVNRLYALPWTVASLLFWALFLKERRAVWLGALAGAGALLCLSGFPELFALNAAVLVVWTIAAEGRGLSCVTSLVRLAAAGVLAIGLAAIQLVPTAFLVRTSERVGSGPRDPLQWSISPRRLPEMAVAGFSGRVAALADTSYWGRHLENQGFPYFLSVYFGLPVLLLAVTGAFGQLSGTGPLRRTRVALFLVVAASLAASLGRFLPGFASGIGAVPGASLFRYPSKFLVAAIWPLALLAGLGAEVLAEERGQRVRRRLARASLAIAVLMAAAAAAIEFWPRFDTLFERFFFRSDAAEAVRGGLPGDFLRAAIAAALLGAFAGAGLATKRFGGHFLAALVAADLLIAGSSVNPFAPRALLGAEPPLASLVRREIGDGTLFRGDDSWPLRLSAPSNDIVWLARWNLEGLAKYTAAGFGIPLVFHLDFDRLADREMVVFSAAVHRRSWTERLRLLSSAGVTAVLREKEPETEGLVRVAEVPLLSGPTVVLDRNPAALPLASLVRKWRNAATLDEAIAVITTPGFDLRHEAVVTGGNAGGSPDGTMSVRSLGGDRTADARYAVATDGRALLVRTIPVTPGWRVAVDGTERPVIRTNGVFQGVFVNPGDRIVRFTYRPPGLLAGGLVSLVSLVLLVALARYPRTP